MVESETTRLLIDSSPDLRQQLLAADITTVDAVLYTHAHADHTHGIDDLRSLNFHRDAPIPIYADADTLSELQTRFAYAFEPPIANYGWFRPALLPHRVDVENRASIPLGDLTIQPFEQRHGSLLTLGFRIGEIAYSTDVNHLPEASVEALKGVRIWVVDCLRRAPAPTHAHLDLTLEWIDRVRPERAFLTHMSHEFDYESLCRELPEGVEPAYDGLVVQCE